MGLLLLRDKHEVIYNTHNHIIYIIFIFICLFSSYFSRYILPNINDQSVIIMTVIFLFIFYMHFLPKYMAFFSHPLSIGDMQVGVYGLNGFAIKMIRIMQILFFGLTALLITNALIPGPTPGYLKTIFSVWYLLMQAMILIPALVQGDFWDVIVDNPVITNYVGLIMLGMVTLDLSINVLNALYIIPIPVFRESWQHAIMRAKMQRQLLNSKYSKKNSNPFISFIYAAVTVIALYVSYCILKWDNLIVLSIALLALRYFQGSTYYVNSR